VAPPKEEKPSPKAKEEKPSPKAKKGKVVEISKEEKKIGISIETQTNITLEKMDSMDSEINSINLQISLSNIEPEELGKPLGRTKNKSDYNPQISISNIETEDTEDPLGKT